MKRGFWIGVVFGLLMMLGLLRTFQYSAILTYLFALLCFPALAVVATLATYLPRSTASTWVDTVAIGVNALFYGLAGAFIGWLKRRRRAPPGHCQKCDYDLTGNESGICPECGTKIPGQPKQAGGESDE